MHKHSITGPLREYDIWSEGFAATGERSGAILLSEGYPEIYAHSFDEAVEKLVKMWKGDKKLFQKSTPSRYMSPEAYENRRSNWSFWACNLFDNEQDARVSFG